MSMIPKTKHGEHLLKSTSFIFNPQDNGGESFYISTRFISNGDDFKAEDPDSSFFLDQTLTLHSYCNSASINLQGTPITPKSLREMADKLEAAWEQARQNSKRLTETAKEISNPCCEVKLGETSENILSVQGG